VEVEGIRYGGKLYKSLSSAAMAAAKDLALSHSAANGFTFWGLSKPPRPAGQPLAALERAWERYQERASRIVTGATDESREQVRTALGKHVEAVRQLQQKVA
jgi:hypothetical protein